MTAFYLDRAKRFEVVAPVTFLWSRAKGPAESGKGVTKNISKSGILVATKECPPPGARIQMTVRMPRAEDKGYGMELHGEGTVVRVETDASAGSGARPIGFAASVDFYPEPVTPSEQQH